MFVVCCCLFMRCVVCRCSLLSFLVAFCWSVSGLLVLLFGGACCCVFFIVAD